MQQRVAHWIRAGEEGTIECVGAVKEVVLHIVTYFVSLVRLSGKEQGPRQDL
jgi:hypothetical protein